MDRALGSPLVKEPRRAFARLGVTKMATESATHADRPLGIARAGSTLTATGFATTTEADKGLAQVRAQAGSTLTATACATIMGLEMAATMAKGTAATPNEGRG